MVKAVLHRDYETRSAADLKKVGAHVYAQHPTTDVLVACYILEDDHGNEWEYEWRPGQPKPLPVVEHIAGGGKVEGHNAAFEAAIDKEIMGPRYGWPVPALEAEHCTMARCAIQALPLDLARAVKALGLAHEKDEAGHKLMLKMCKPRKPRKGEPADAILLWHEDPADLDRLALYCMRDVRAELGLGKALRPMTAEQRRVWLLDQRINRRGVQIDLGFVEHARGFAEAAGVKLNARMAEVTGGAVDKATQIERLKDWAKDHGVEFRIDIKERRNGEEYETEAADREALEDLIEHGVPVKTDGTITAKHDEEGRLTVTQTGATTVYRPLPPEVREAFTIRLQAAKSSVKKLEKFKAQACSDGRARGTLQFHGAGPGRWAGRGIQLQNLIRAGLADAISKENAKLLKALGGAWEVALRDMAELELDAFELVWGPALEAISRMLRGAVKAAPGNKLYFADYAQIEARGTVWAAKQRDAVELFASGGKIYEDMGAFIFGLSIEEVIEGHDSGKNKIPRFCGKEAILGCGYGVGPASFARNAKKKGKVILPFETAQKAVYGWREKNWRVVEYWRELEDAAKAAIESPGKSFWAGPFAYVVKGRWLLCRMPSGRVIYYRRPTIEPKSEDVEQLDAGETVPRYRWAIHYWGVNGITKQWEKESTWGGKLLENCIQGMCVDLLTNAQLNHEAVGYTPVLSVHDEAISETPADFGTVDDFVRIMTDIPAWAHGLPVKAEGGSGLRYAK